MQSEIRPTVKVKVKKYPYLGIFDGIVVLFTKPKTGMCVHNDITDIPIGSYVDDYWQEDKFDELNGEIVLRNDE